MTKRLKTVTKIIAIFLSFLFVLEVAPMQLIADAYSDYSAHKQFISDIVKNPVNQKNKEDVKILYEVNEKRDQFTKVYKKADGTFTAVMSKDPLHFLNGGEWKEIDNSLVSNGDTFTNTANSFSVSFPSKIDKNSSITLKTEDTEIAFSVNDISASKGNVENAVCKTDTKISCANIAFANTQSEIRYKNVADNTDLQYLVIPNGIKENIIVSNKESVKETYSFTLKIGELKYCVNDDGSIDFFNAENEKQFSIPKPIMTDAKGNLSDKIEVSVKDIDDNSISLQYNPSVEWTNASERVYPITIDPIIYIDTYQLRDNWIEDTYVINTSPNGNFVRDTYGYICDRDNMNAEMYSKINIDAIAERFDKNVVFTDVEYMFGAELYGGKILAKEVLSSLDLYTVTYNTKPQLSNEVYDYYTCKFNTEEEANSYERFPILHFNITNLFNKWFNGSENNGFALVAENSDLYAETFNIGTVYGLNTILFFDYELIGGSNNDYSFHEQPVGRAGTCYVNDYSQGLSIVRSELSIDGNNMPVQIGMNYNPAIFNAQRMYGVYLELDEDYVGYGQWLYGNNWIPNYQRGIFATGIELMYFTEYGEEIDFDINATENGIVFSSSEDFGYSVEFENVPDEISIDSDSIDSYLEYIVVKCPNGNIEHFYDNGKLNYITNPDRPNQEISVTYNENGYINYVKDGANRRYNYLYDSVTGMLTKVYCTTSEGTIINAGSTNSPLEINYSYTNGNLTSVTFADGRSVYYTYDSNNNLISVENIDGYKVVYTYDSANRVVNIQEQARNSSNSYVNGNSLTYTRLSNNQIKVTDATANYEIYQFDSKGKLMYSIDRNGCITKSPLRNSSSYYVSTSDTKLNSQNLLKNSSFESNSGEWGNGRIFTRTQTTEAHSGQNVLAVNRANNTIATSGQTVTVENGGKYTVSAYVKSLENNTGTLKLKISALDGSNNTLCYNFVTIENTNNEWLRYMTTIDTQSNVRKIQVEFILDNTSGSFYIDDVQLENAVSASEYNLIENGSFTDSTNHWNILCNSNIVSSSLLDKNVKAIKLNGGTSEYDRFSTDISINGKKNDIYKVGAWFKGNFVKSDGTNKFMDLLEESNLIYFNFTHDRFAQIQVDYLYVEEENGVEVTKRDTIVIPFADLITDWQYASDEFVLKGDTDSITVSIHYQNNANSALFTNFELSKDSDAIAIADDEETNNEPERTCPCDNCEEAECLCACESEDVCTCIQCKRRGNIETKDTFGNVTSTKIFDGLKYIEYLSEYTEDGNYLINSTDADNCTTSYDINTLNGILNGTTDPNGNTVNYVYDAYALLRSISINNSTDPSANYIYCDDKLSGICHNDFYYNVYYNIWGQIDRVEVSDCDVNHSNGANRQTIVSYEYGENPYRDRLLAIQYNDSNNTRIEYFYDGFGNISSIKENGTVKYSLSYDAFGALSEIVAMESRIVRFTDGRTDILDFDNHYIYSSYLNDDGENVEIIGNISYSTKDYPGIYDQTSGVTTEKNDIKISNGKTVGTVADKDWFGRYTNSIVKTESAIDTNTENYFAAIKAEYTYPEYSDDKTSDRVTDYVNKVYYGKNTNESNRKSFVGYHYEYDNNGNITAEYKKYASGATTLNYSYEYDNINQLVRVNDVSASKTYTYEYDSAGNIVAKNEYPYTTSENLGTANNTITYSYDNIWKDKLTQCGSTSFEYDNAGNPTVIGNNELTWCGRQLESYRLDDNHIIEFLYDENGLRHRKIVKEGDSIIEQYDYVWSNDKLVSQTYSSFNNNVVTSKNTAKFIYDSFGTLHGFILNDTNVYLYTKNLQGDITGIVNESGNAIITYSYDAWGAVTFSATSMQNMALAYTLSFVSPFTYRGYCYDYDIELYYLQSRYYSPEFCRFINTDDTQIAIDTQGEILGANLFAYCNNNPIINVDFDGYLAQALVGAFVGGLFAFGMYYLEYILKMRSWNYAVLIGIIAYNAAINALIWYLGLGGLLQKFLKLYGYAQKILIGSKYALNMLKALSFFASGLKIMGNMIIKKATRYPGESWGTAITRFIRKHIGIAI